MKSGLIAEALSLPAAHRRQLVRALEASLVRDRAPKLSDEVCAELDRRLAAFKKNPSNGIAWLDVERRVRARLRKGA